MLCNIVEGTKHISIPAEKNIKVCFKKKEVIRIVVLNGISTLTGYLIPNPIYTYIYIFTNLISTSIHGTRKKKNEKNPEVSRITTQGKKKKIIGQKERKGQPRPTP